MLRYQHVACGSINNNITTQTNMQISKRTNKQITTNLYNTNSYRKSNTQH